MPLTVLAVLISLLISLFLVLVTLGQESRTPPRAWLGLPQLLYLGLIGIGNAMSTLLASTVLPDIGLDPPWWEPVIWAFFGVFAFEAVFKNTKLFNQDALDIRKWTEAARDYAVADATERQVRFDEEHLERCARALAELPEPELDALLRNHDIPGVRIAARQTRMGVQLLKAYRLAGALDDHGAAILKGRARRRRSWVPAVVAVVAVAAVLAALLLGWLALRRDRPASTPRPARPAVPAPPAASAAELAARTVSAKLQDENAAAAVQKLARQIGARALVDRSIACKVDFALEDSRFGDVMDAVCTICSCTWKIEPGNPPSVVVDPRPPSAPAPAPPAGTGPAEPPASAPGPSPGAAAAVSSGPAGTA